MLAEIPQLLELRAIEASDLVLDFEILANDPPTKTTPTRELLPELLVDVVRQLNSTTGRTRHNGNRRRLNFPRLARAVCR